MNRKRFTVTYFRENGNIERVEETEYEFDEGICPNIDGFYKPGPTQVNTAWLKEKIDAVHDAVYEGERDCD